MGLSQLVLAWALTFAAGAMIYVISHEIIPETHRHGFESHADHVVADLSEVHLEGCRRR